MTGKKLLLEANGSLTAKYMVQAALAAKIEPIGSDIHADTICAALGHKSIIVPVAGHPTLWDKIQSFINEYGISDVVPTLDETLIEWSEKKEFFKKLNCKVHISDSAILKIFQDKWETYKFFQQNDIPTPMTSLDNVYPVTKPRFGRGSVGVEYNNAGRQMHGLISQEFCEGQEFTVDVFLMNNEPVYIIPRKRLRVVNGKSTISEVFKSAEIEEIVRTICRKCQFSSAINLQGFITASDIKLIEINPRFGGGTALGFAASENWLSLLVNGVSENWSPKPITYGKKMTRFYDDFFN